MTAITAITAQNTQGVDGVHAIPTEMVLAQIDSILDDLDFDAIKIGMIGSAETTQAVAELMEDLGAVKTVFDPVMVATSGSTLADSATIAAFERLMKWCSPITPNWPELAALTEMQVSDERSALDAAGELSRRHGTAVLAKGGHGGGEEVVDLLVEQTGKVTRWAAPRIKTVHNHGTGCTLASAIAVCLARGLSLPEAVTIGRDYVRAAMRAAPGFGAGHGPMGHALGVVPFDLVPKKE
jgi:hydroxymethylpyrimidine/phosphomethylpyrimidine kinase